MRIFLFCKWLVLVLLMVCAVVLAYPYLFAARLIMRGKAEAFHEELGKQLARNCAVDFSRLKGR